jgi:molybdopterin converting factor small subunit
MRVEIRFRGPLAAKEGMRKFNMNLKDGTNLGEFLEILIESEEAVRGIWTDPEIIDREALILRNGTDVGLTGGLTTVLEDDDRILVLPLVHGG